MYLTISKFPLHALNSLEHPFLNFIYLRVKKYIILFLFASSHKVHPSPNTFHINLKISKLRIDVFSPKTSRKNASLCQKQGKRIVPKRSWKPFCLARAFQLAGVTLPSTQPACVYLVSRKSKRGKTKVRKSRPHAANCRCWPGRSAPKSDDYGI